MNTHQFADDAVLGLSYHDHVETLKARHDRALEKAGGSHAIIFSGTAKGRFLDDSHYPFRANPHFVSWLPLTGTPHCYLVHTPGEKPLLIYYQEKDYWHLPPESPEGYWTAEYDIRIVNSLEDAADLLPPDKDNCILIGEINHDSQTFGIDRINPNTAMNILHYARASKTTYELECMRAASRRGVAGHRAAKAAFQAGSSEFDIHLAYCRAVGQNEKDLPYGNIIGHNENSAVLHYQYQSPVVPQEIRSFLIDAGATVYGYASDITRTYSFESSEYQSVIDRVDAMQQEIVSEVMAGLDYTALHIRTHEKLAVVLTDLELASGSVEDLIINGVTSAFFPHGLGHFLGLQVHDVGGFMADEGGAVIERPPNHPFLRLTRRLEADQVLTIEPGLYVIDMLLDNLQGTPGHAMLNQNRIDWLRPFGGIRIEDNIRVLDDGTENLTRDAFAA